MAITPTEKIWLNGELIPWDEARIHVLTHSLHYGTAVIEGMRAYETDAGPAVFRLTDHMERLRESALVMSMPFPYTVEELVQAAKDTVRASGLAACYVRPIVYYRYGEMVLSTLGCGVDVAIACWSWDAYLGGTDRADDGVRLAVSSWARADHNALPTAAKTSAGYVTGSLAKIEALRAGYDEAILLNRHGYVAECTAENIFCARRGKLLTPPESAGALNGITRRSLLTIARDLGFETHSTNLTRSDLYVADELFVCGTAAEVHPVAEVDDRPVPGPGPMTRALADEYDRAVHGRADRYKDWVEHVD